MSEPVLIRLAGAVDLAALHPLVESAYRGDSARSGWTHEADLIAGQRTSVEALGAVVADPRERVLLAEQEGRLVGCVQVTDKGGGTAYLGMLCVAPTLQANGLGRRLIAEAERLAAEVFGALHMEMTVIDLRRELIGYYQRRGYVLSGEKRPFPVPLVPPLEMVVLTRPLS